jgi:predicted dehydrogenase
MRIGIVGAENSHCAHIAKSLNAENDVPGCEVTHVWGETPEFAAKAAEEGRIPNIVGEYTEMIGAVDGVVVDHRHAKHHLPAARPFVEAGIPVFVDKPFCIDLDEGVEFVRFAREKGVAITSYSVLSLQRSVGEFVEALRPLGNLRSLVTAGPGDVDDPNGGVYFYGIHQVDLVSGLLDRPARSVHAIRHGDDGLAAITFEGGPIVAVHLLKDWWGAGFTATACGEEGVGAHHSTLPMDEKMYLTGIERFCRMFESGEEPLPPIAYLRPVAILAAMQESFDTGLPVAVRAVPEV